MTGKFVVAFDGSEASERALEHAIRVASGLDASLTAVYAVNPQVYSSGGDAPVRSRSDADRRLVVEAVEDAERRGEEILERAAARAEDDDYAVETELLYGAPVAAVADFAEDEGYDGIFVGHKGLSESYERVLGSVAKGLVERSRVPVTVVR